MPPETCPDGTQPNAAVTPPAVTSAPATSTPVQYSWFTTEIAWSYWFNYLTVYSVNRKATTSIASYQVTSTTTVSVTASNSDQAASLFDAMTATMSFATPTGIAFIVTGTPPSTTHSSTTEASSTTAVSSNPQNSASQTSSSSASSSPTVSTLTPYSGAESATRTGATILGHYFSAFIGAFIVGPGLLIFWL
jgi:hypothetical protein